MEESSKRAVERGLAWCGPLFVVGIIYTWGIMGHNIPPPNMMAMTPDQLISEYYGKYPEIGVGMILSATFVLHGVVVPSSILDARRVWQCWRSQLHRACGRYLDRLALRFLFGDVGRVFSFDGSGFTRDHQNGAYYDVVHL
jgi:hypothetical protein